MECKTCGELYFPSRSLCLKCRRQGKLEVRRFSGKGTVYSYTVIHAPPQGFELHKPYIMAIVELDEGPRLTAQIVDCKNEEIKIGSRVESVFRRISEDREGGIIQYGYKFKLAD